MPTVLYPPPPYGYYPGAYEPASALRIEVTPSDAEVFLDGYLVGIVDDFDGFFQRLRVRPGAHEIDIVRDGFHSVHQKLFLEPDRTFRVRYTMNKLKAGEAPDPRPVPRADEPETRRVEGAGPGTI